MDKFFFVSVLETHYKKLTHKLRQLLTQFTQFVEQSQSYLLLPLLILLANPCFALTGSNKIHSMIDRKNSSFNEEANWYLINGGGKCNLMEFTDKLAQDKFVKNIFIYDTVLTASNGKTKNTEEFRIQTISGKTISLYFAADESLKLSYALLISVSGKFINYDGVDFDSLVKRVCVGDFSQLNLLIEKGK